MVNGIQIAKLFARMGFQFGSVFVAASNAPTWVKLIANYKCDGTADEVEINAAITAANGGKVVLSSGTFNTADKITTTANTTLEGQGKSTIIKLANATSKNIVEISNVNNVTLKNLVLDGNRTNQADGGSDSLQNALFIYQSYNFVIENITAQNARKNGIRIEDPNGVNLEPTYRGVLSKVVSTANSTNGLYVTAYAEYMSFEACSFLANYQSGIKLETANLSFDGCMVMKNWTHGIIINTSAKSRCATFTNCKINHNSQHGVWVISGQEGPALMGCDVIANGYHGLNILSTKTSVIGCRVYSSSQSANNTYDDINLAATASRNIITGNDMYREGSTARYGINEVSGANYNKLISNNVFGQVTGTIVVTGANSVNQYN
jgi:hypothetical protein